MSTPTAARVSAGVPDGGQFARSANAEATDVVLDGPATAPLPSWGPELEQAISDGVTKWTEGLQDGRETVDLSEVVDGLDDEDAMIEAYGEHRSDWLCGVQIEASVRTSQISSRYLPPEDRLDGRLYIRSGDTEIGTVNFGDHDGEPRISVLGHCPPAPPAPGDPQTTTQTNHDSTSSMKMVLDPDGRLTDAADGTLAWQRFNSRGQLLKTAHYQTGELHSPTPGAPASIEHLPDGSTITERADHGVLADGPNGEPSREERHADGRMTQTFQTAGRWNSTVELDRNGRKTSELRSIPQLPGATLQTQHEPATGRSQITRRDSAGVEIDGPDGEPAVEFRRHGRVTSQTWKSKGVWTKTTDYGSDGQPVVGYVNDNWPGE